nr:MAG TPA: Sep15/SelM redox domain [Caudoviricetes sp.]
MENNVVNFFDGHKIENLSIEGWQREQCKTCQNKR